MPFQHTDYGDYDRLHVLNCAILKEDFMSEECVAHPKFKEVFKPAKAEDAMATPQLDSRLPVISVRDMKYVAFLKF